MRKGAKFAKISIAKIYIARFYPALINLHKVIDLQNSSTWNIQLTITNNFISSKDAAEERVMHSTSNNIKFTPYSDVNEVINELFEPLRLIYQRNLETSMRGS